jgi:protein-tyrosine kinase
MTPMAVTRITESPSLRDVREKAAPVKVDVSPLRLEDMVNLYRSVLAAFPDSQCRIVQLVSANPGEGTSTVARGLAEAAAAIGNARVLLCDATAGHDAFRHFGMSVEIKNLNDVISEGLDLRLAIEPIPGRGFAICALADPGAGAHVAVNVDAFDPVLDALRKQFDLIVIDSPPLNRGVLGAALAKKSDGVVVVVEAEKTRIPVVGEARRVIEINGGNVLGVVLNKRRFHVPRFVYRWI